jgi:cobalt/nickel transport system permease protein
MQHLPLWLTSEYSYIPQKDKDAFVDKSILAILQVLSRIRSQGGYSHRSKIRANATIKLVFVLLSIVLVSISGQFSFVIPVAVGVLLWMSTLKAELIARLIRTALIVVAFTVVILIPTVFFGNMYSIEMIPVKVFITITMIGIVSYTTRWDEITGSLRLFRIPALFIFVLDITIKYIYLLSELSLNMLYALKLRSVGRNKGKYASLSGVAGTIFLKSREMAMDTNAAMQCRGFTGEYKSYHKMKIEPGDFIYFSVTAAIVLLFVYIGR